MRCMAKLHALMSADLPRIIDPGKFADSGERLEGQLQLQELDRIRELNLDGDAAVRFSLAFDRDEKGAVVITGELSGQLTVACQRCLNPMRLTLQSRINVGVVDDPKQMVALPEELEPVIAEEHKVSLLRLIEEELLLAMPLSPVHELSACPGAGLVGQHATKKENPFAVLKDLKSGKQ